MPLSGITIYGLRLLSRPGLCWNSSSECGINLASYLDKSVRAYHTTSKLLFLISRIFTLILLHSIKL